MQDFSDDITTLSKFILNSRYYQQDRSAEKEYLNKALNNITPQAHVTVKDKKSMLTAYKLKDNEQEDPKRKNAGSNGEDPLQALKKVKIIKDTFNKNS